MTIQDLANDTIATLLAAGTAIEEEAIKGGQYGDWKWLIYILAVVYFAFRIRSEYHKGTAHRNMKNKIELDNEFLEDMTQKQKDRDNTYKDRPLKSS